MVNIPVEHHLRIGFLLLVCYACLQSTKDYNPLNYSTLPAFEPYGVAKI